MKLAAIVGILCTTLVPGVAPTIYFAGVAESSGEFGVYSKTPGTGLPGRFGVDYSFINEGAIDVYVDKNKVCHARGVARADQWAYLGI